MNWNDFIEATSATAVYPDAGKGTAAEFAYIGLGLAGEVGEMWEAKTFDDRYAELGDCLWYVARAFSALQIVGYGPDGEFTNVGLYPNPGLPALLIGNETKKLMRDGMKATYLNKLQHLYHSAYLALLMEIEAMAQRDGCQHYSLHHLLDTVVLKLMRRKREGKIHGSGDKR